MGLSHRDHLGLAWDVIGRRGPEAAPAAVGEALRLLAAVHGEADRYNETMTRFWVAVVGHARALHGPAGFDGALAAEPHLLDPGLPFRHWSRGRLLGPDARAGWVDPDLRPLPLLEKPTS